MRLPAVWYASYGSNLSLERFRRYLDGDDAHPGARDTSPPEGDRPVRLGHRLYFGSGGSRWDRGGTAFLGQRPAAGATALGRAYLVSLSQFEDVLAQENRAPTRSVDLGRLEAVGTLSVHDGRYGTVLWCGLDGEVPLVTFTAALSFDEGDPSASSPPTIAYLRAMATGLAEAFGMGPRESAGYLWDKPGLAGTYSLEELACQLG